jgi:hypothetical protein
MVEYFLSIFLLLRGDHLNAHWHGSLALGAADDLGQEDSLCYTGIFRPEFS